MLCYKITPTFSKVTNSTTHRCAHMALYFLFQKRGQITPNIGNHRANISRVRNSTTKRFQKTDLSGGTVSNSWVVLFLTLDLLVADEKNVSSFSGTVSNS